MQLLISFVVFYYGVNVGVKIDLSIDNFIFFEIIKPKQILYG